MAKCGCADVGGEAQLGRTAWVKSAGEYPPLQPLAKGVAVPAEKAAAAEAIEKGGRDGQDGGSGEASLPVKPLAVYFEELTKKRQGMLKKRGRDGDDGGGGGKKGRTALPFDEAYPRGTVAAVSGRGEVFSSMSISTGRIF